MDEIDIMIAQIHTLRTQLIENHTERKQDKIIYKKKQETINTRIIKLRLFKKLFNSINSTRRHQYIHKIDKSIKQVQLELFQIKENRKANGKLLRQCNNRIINSIDNIEFQIESIQDRINNNIIF